MTSISPFSRVGLAVLLLAVPASARAQGAVVRPHTFEVSAGAAWAGRDDLGSREAKLTRNPALGSDPLVLFRTSGELEPKPGFGGSVAYNLTRLVAGEASFLMTRPSVRTTIANDSEGAASTTFDGGRLSQYLIEGSVVVHLPVTVARGRVAPYARAGVGYLRQVLAEGFGIEEGRVYHAGAGIKALLASRTRGFIEGFGVRGEARIVRRDDGFHFDRQRGTFPAVSGGVFLVF